MTFEEGKIYTPQEIVNKFTEALYNNGIDHSNDPRYYKAIEQVLDNENMSDDEYTKAELQKSRTTKHIAC